MHAPFSWTRQSIVNRTADAINLWVSEITVADVADSTPSPRLQKLLVDKSTTWIATSAQVRPLT
jgi:hypothetical protein